MRSSMKNRTLTTPIPETTYQLLHSLLGTGVMRVIISDTRIDYFPKMTQEAIDRVTANPPLYRDVMRHHFPATRQPGKFHPGDYDLTGRMIRFKT